MKNIFKLSNIVVFLFFVLLGASTYVWFNLEKFLHPTLIPPQSYWVDEDKPVREQITRIEVAGKLMDIPTAYIQSHIPPGTKKVDSILLRVIWPDMKSLHDLKDRAEYERVWRDEKRLGSVLVDNLKTRTPLD